LPESICGIGDTFEMAHSATIYNVIDMEAYALAMIAMKENIPFLFLEYISDGADGNAAEEDCTSSQSSCGLWKHFEFE